MIETIISIQKYDIYNIYMYTYSNSISISKASVYIYKQYWLKNLFKVSEYKRSKISKILQHSREVSKNYTIVLLSYLYFKAEGLQSYCIVLL